MPYLNEQDFELVMRSVPIVAIDLIDRNHKAEVLLGLRNNAPARNYWFTPGGRIRKGETMADAFRRLARNELGFERQIGTASFLGIFEHFYEDNFSNDFFGTHYVDLAYEFRASDLDIHLAPLEQHREFRWFSTEELLESEHVHPNVKMFFDVCREDRRKSL